MLPWGIPLVTWAQEDDLSFNTHFLFTVGQEGFNPMFCFTSHTITIDLTQQSFVANFIKGFLEVHIYILHLHLFPSVVSRSNHQVP